MKLKDLLNAVDSEINIEISGVKEVYKIKSDIPEILLQLDVKRIYAAENVLVVELEKAGGAATLEQLGYSFDIGV